MLIPFIIIISFFDCLLKKVANRGRKIDINNIHSGSSFSLRQLYVIINAKTAQEIQTEVILKIFNVLGVNFILFFNY